MNGDWIAQDVEPDICCQYINVGCTCELERVHEQQIKNNGFQAFNIGWAIDEHEGYISSKVGFPGNPTVFIFTTTIAGEATWVHSFN